MTERADAPGGEVSIAALRQRSRSLAAVSDSPQLDVDLLLCFSLQRPRSYLYAWPEKTLSAGQLQCFEQLLQRRAAGEPVAYLLGEKAFWSLTLAVSPATLIPRPDTERLVELALEKTATLPPGALLDLGTGTGAIALAFATERPHWQVTAVDNSAEAVALAKHNRDRLQLEQVEILQSDWFEALAGRRFAMVLSNPPYIAADDPHLHRGDVRSEPHSALVAADQGLAAIKMLIAGAPAHLLPGAWLLLEHGYNQGAAVRELLRAQGFDQVATWRDYGDNERVSGGQWNNG